MAAPYPSLVTVAFASSGTKNTIQIASHGPSSALASFHDGFPSKTLTQKVSGGLPPFGADFNGILYELTSFQLWANGGGQFYFDSGYATLPGYPSGAVLQLNDKSGSVVNLSAGNTADPNSDMTNWAPFSGGIVLSGNYDATETGTGNAYVVALNPPQSTRRDGVIVRFKAARSNTGAATLNAGGGAAALVRNDGSAVISGDLLAGSMYSAIYDTATGKYWLTAPVLSQQFMVGASMDWYSAVLPGGWLEKDGSAISRTTYAALFAIIGTAWGAGDGINTFNLPDDRGRASIGAGHGSGLSVRNFADSLGEETHVLDITEMPSHTHNYNNGTTHHTNASGNNFQVCDDVAFSPIATTSAGSSDAHNNMQPSIVVRKIIKY